MSSNCQFYPLLLFCTGLFFPAVINAQESTCDETIEGVVFDIVTKEVLPFATVSVQESGQGAVTNEKGEFEIENVCDKEVHLEVRFIGYKTVVHHHDFHHEDPMIFLASDETLLDGIVIEETRLTAFQTLNIQNLDFTDVELLTSTIGELTEQISGISILKTGSNISKPIVHGLHSNRVLVMNDGLRHAYQVWGDGHAPEIDPSHIDRIEVVKGAGTVKYGPEALGGVVLYNSKRPVLDQEWTGSLGSSYSSNGRAHSGQINIEHGSHRFAWNASGFGIRQADLRAPSYDLTNTGKREYGGSFNTLFHQPNFELQVSGSYLDQELGILRGSLVGNLQDLQNAIERGVPSPTFAPSYKVQNPKHVTEHGLLKTNLTYFLGDHILKAQYGIQRNIRKEFDVRRGELNDRPVIDLELLSHTFEIEWVQPTIGKWKGNTGIQMFSQNSTNEVGSNPINFVPDYDVFNIGAYTIQSINLGKTVFELGTRIDYQTLSVVDTIRDVTIYSNEVDFTNATFTLGFNTELSETLSIFSNIGTAWRPPNVSELYSFGYHFSRIQFGLWRYTLEPRISTPLTRVFDATDRTVNSERSLKLVSGVNFKNDKLNAELIFYVNRINDYIFLRPFGITTNVAGTFPFFIYDQTNAIFWGSDWDIRYKHNENLTSEAKFSYVYANEIENDQPFIEIPPFNVNYSLRFDKDNWGVELNMNYMAQQWRAPRVIEPATFQNGGAEFSPNEIFDFMAAPKDYFLFGAKFNYEHDPINFEINVTNILNTSYRSYTDRLRYFSDAQGRNFSFSISFKF